MCKLIFKSLVIMTAFNDPFMQIRLIIGQGVENNRVNVSVFSNRVKRVENDRVNLILFSSRVTKVEMIEST